MNSCEQRPDQAADDDEVCALRDEYQGRWHVERMRSGALSFAREPGRGYRIVQGSAADAAESVARYEQNGYLVR